MIDRRHFLRATPLLWPSLARSEALENLRILTGFPPGGTVDLLARRVADKLRGGFAKTTRVENKPGAGGRLAVEELKRSAADGNTLLITPAAMITLYPHLFTRLSYGLEDVTPVCSAAEVVFGLALGPAVPEAVQTLEQFLEWARANPGFASFGSPGTGTPPHLLGALLGKESGVMLYHVPYRGTALGVQDLLGGQVAAFSGPIGDYLPHVKAGKLRVLATSGPSRTRFLPDVPTLAEAGFSTLEQVEWYGFFLPGRAPQDLVQRTARALQAALTASDMPEAFAQYGLELAVNTPAELSQAVKTESAAWGRIIKRVGFMPE